ncbi:sigma-70 family RNA polymerase sigma factor [Microvirga massiliensis]|uniref:sigma-70 family RNA polymerase sigma factor n=1 Tax=Microvirga massiliensis TaxID=1033741 RepID=UPI00062B6564|nr:sigma-70 family RNA polymerase sigma factor [Microvirga massiliensis]
MSEIGPLVEPHIPALRRYARSLIHDTDAADDLVQDCLEHAIARWHLRRRDGNLRGWLFAILHNLFVSSLRQRSRRGGQVSLDVGQAMPASGGGQEEQLAVRDLLTGLQLLPPDQRAVLLLVAVEEMTYAEAAQVLSVPIGTVMSRLSRGRESLRQYMETGQPITAKRCKLRRVK